MIISVIPLIKLPRKLVFFDYEVPQGMTLERFSIVIVPWRKTKITALVVDIKNIPYQSDKIIFKKVIKILNHGRPIATTNQFDLITRLAKDFFISPSIWWKTILPKFPINKKIEFSNISTSSKHSKNYKKNNNKINLIIIDSFHEMTTKLIEQLNLNNQQLILCPEIIDLNYIYKNLPDNLKKQTVLYHKSLKNKELLTNYFKIINNQAKIIIGTKLSVLLPFYNLKNIFVFKSDNYGFSTGDQNPRYNLDQIYSYLKSIYQVPLNLYTFSPWVDTYAFLKKEKQEIKDYQQPLKFKLVDMAIEKNASNYSYLSWPLEQAIKSTLSKNKKCLLFVNRKGLKQYIYCQDCGWHPTCNKCDGYLKMKNQINLMCGTCQLTYPLPTFCQRCQSVKLKNFGLTNQSLVEILKKITKRNDIVYVDSENKNPLDQINIVVATKYFLPRLDAKYGLIAFVDGDQELISHNYRSFELAWQFFNNAFRLLPNSIKIIQTQKVDHFFWNYLNHYTYQKFWQKEMLWRKKMNFPPYTKTIKLIIKGKSQKQIRSIKEDLLKKFNKEFINLMNVTDFEIIFSYSLVNYSQIKDLLSKLPESIMIEFNPYEI